MPPGVPPVSNSTKGSSYTKSCSSGGTPSTSAQHTSPDHSYFSPHAPLTSPRSAPTPSFNTNAISSSAQYQTTHTTTVPGGPVITSITSTRADGGMGYSSIGVNNVHGFHPAHLNPLEMHQQFALQIPPPPPLTLSSSAMRNPGALGTTSLGSSSSAGAILTQRPPPAAAPQMTLSSTAVKHSLSVLLPRNIQPEMVTISANKGDRIRVVADAFGRDECESSSIIFLLPHHHMWLPSHSCSSFHHYTFCCFALYTSNFFSHCVSC